MSLSDNISENYNIKKYKCFISNTLYQSLLMSSLTIIPCLVVKSNHVLPRVE